MASPENAAVRRTVETIVAAGVSAVFAFAYVIVVGRLLGPAAYADFAAALSVIYFCAVAMTPVTPTLARVIAAMAVRREDHAIAAMRRSVILRAAIVVVVVSMAGAAIAPFVAQLLRFRSPMTFGVAIVTAALFALLSVDRGVLHGLLLFRDYNVSTIVETGVRLAGAVLLLTVATTPTAPAALSSYAAGVVIAEMIIAVRLRRVLASDGPIAVDWKPVTRLAAPMIALMIALAVFQNADMLAVKRWFPAVESGQYGAASALAKAIGVVFVPLYVLAGPLLTRAYESGRRIVGPAVQLCLVFIALAAVPTVATILWPEQLVRALYGPSFSGAAHVIAPLAGVAILTYCALMLVQILITAGSFAFLRVYGVIAVLQTAALFAFHDTFGEVIAVLYAGQATVLVAVIVMVRRFSVLHDAKLHLE